MLRQVLIVDPEGDGMADLVEVMRRALPDSSEVLVVRETRELLRHLGGQDDRRLVIVHGELGDGEIDGLEVVRRVRRDDRYVPVVVTADRGDVGSADRAIAVGATDFLVRGGRLPDRVNTVLNKLRGLFAMIDRNRALDEQNAQLRLDVQARFQLVGRSPQLQAVLEQVQRVAKVPRPLLIVGERGTGKELVARAIHYSAGDSQRPIVTVNCAAFPEALLESELFGHERGAFTSADATRAGKFEIADGGTLFLDEIGNMALSFQRKILRVVEYGAFTRVGGHEELRSGARIIAATNRDLKAMIREGAFLNDLYDRLAFELIHVPPLREREGDIEMLAMHFLNQFAMEIPAFRGKLLSRRAVEVLEAYPFPGNVRELKNIIERAAYRDTTNEITPVDIGMLEAMSPAAMTGSFTEQIEALSRRLIEDAMKAAEGNKAQAARLLGLSYHQFRYYHAKYSAA